MLRRLIDGIPLPIRGLLRDWIPPAIIRRLPPPTKTSAPAAEDDGNRVAGLQEPRGKPAAAAIPPEVRSFFCIAEVDEAEPLVGALFFRRFNTTRFPGVPRHFVAFATLPDGSLLTLGYVHYSRWEGCELCGGLVIDDRHYRRLPPPMREALKAAGGVAELLLSETFRRLPEETLVIWGYVGDLQSRKVCLRVGFERTEHKYLLAVWRRDFSPDQKAAWLERAQAIGPF